MRWASGLKRRTPLRKYGKSDRSKLVRRLDRLFSLLVKKRLGKICHFPKCQYRGRIEASHIFSKAGHPSTRWDFDNAIPLCWTHHQMGKHMGSHEVIEFERGFFGEEKYEALRIRAKISIRRTMTDLLYLEEELKRKLNDLNRT